jgi:hypothetical protein
MSERRDRVTKERLSDLERTVDLLSGRLQEMQWAFRQTRTQSLAERLRKSLRCSWWGDEFMSAVCNRRVRPNMKVVNYDHATTQH